MEDESRTEGRRRWQRWTEEQARSALQELAQSGVSIAKFAESKGVSVQRIAYWRKRLAEGGPSRFVRVDVSHAATSTAGRIEILLGDITVRVREDVDAESVARLVEALARRPRGC